MLESAKKIAEGLAAAWLSGNLEEIASFASPTSGFGDMVR